MNNPKNIGPIRPTTVLSAFEPKDLDAGREQKLPEDYVSKTVLAILTLGFRQGALDDTKVQTIVDMFDAVSKRLGHEVNLDRDDIPEDARRVVGLFWMRQILDMVIGRALSKDPLKSLAVIEAWNEVHTSLVLSELEERGLEADVERFIDMVEGAEEAVVQGIQNVNETGCPCGKCGKGDSEKSEAELDQESISIAEALGVDLFQMTLDGLPPEMRAKVDAYARASGRTPRDLVAEIVGIVRPDATVEVPAQEELTGNMAKMRDLIASKLEAEQGAPLTSKQSEAITRQLLEMKASIERGERKDFMMAIPKLGE